METGKVLILKTVNAQGLSHGGFAWPEIGGEVVAPDWDSTPICGGGLHGALWGEGDGELFDFSSDAIWLVFEADEYVNLGGKVKAPRGIVRARGDRESVTAWLAKKRPDASIIGGTSTAGNHGTSTAGDGGTSSAGYRGTATAGAGGTAAAGNEGTAAAGYRGTATAGDGGTAAAGDRGTAAAGDGGTSTAGDGGIILIKYYDYAASRKRICVGYVGEDGIKANTPYRCEGGKLIPVNKESE